MGLVSTVSLLHEYKRQVSHIVDNFIQDNLAVLKKIPETVEKFYLNINVIGSRRFTYLAFRGEALNDSEEEEYAQTWLHKHHLTVLEEVVSVEGEVCEDNEDTTVEGEVCEDNENTTFQESSTKQDEALPVRQKVLRWNCPTAGVKCIMLLTDLLTKLGAEDIVSAYQKQPGFAGFWYETKFFMHRKGHSLIIVSILPKENLS